MTREEWVDMMVTVIASQRQTSRIGEWVMPFKIGPLELVLIIVVLMLIFGVGKLPQVGEAMGKAVRQFRKNQDSSFDSDGAEEDKVKSGKSV